MVAGAQWRGCLGAGTPASGGVGTLGYDGRGNVTGIGSKTYTYSAENRLVTGPGGFYLTYEPGTDRILQLYTPTTDIRFAYSGNQKIGEMTAGNILRRYVHGPGDDAPLVWYEGSGTTDRRWLIPDERGSIVAVTDGTGNVMTINSNLAINRYDEYGIPAATNAGRFQYTGQAWLPEIGMYYYKARIYSPTLGRFMQSDPIGYGSGMNMYGYVGGDPVNATDPSGLVETNSTSCVALFHGGGAVCTEDVQKEIVVTGFGCDACTIIKNPIFTSFGLSGDIPTYNFGSALSMLANGAATVGPQSVDRCAAQVTDNPGARFGGKFEYDPQQALLASLISFGKHSRGNSAGRSTFGGDVTTPIAVFNAVNLVTPGSFAVRAGDAGRAGYSVRVTAATGMIVGNDRFSGGASTQYITAIFNIDVPAGASKNGIAQARLVTTFPGCPRR